MRGHDRGAAIVVLGCKIRFDAQGRLLGPAKRRVDAAAQAWKGGGAHGAASPLVVVSGGRMWNGVVEADALERALVEQGVPKEHILRERCSFHTVDNARFTSSLLERRGVDEIFLVTCDWHLPRARFIFERQGLRVHEVPAASPPAKPAHRVWLWGRERVATLLSRWTMLCLTLVAVAAVPGCRKQEGGTSNPPADAAPIDPVDWATFARAEDQRRASDIDESMLTHPDVRVRLRAARALARIADGASIPGLMRVLADADESVVVWAAYGLGFACKGNEERHVEALSARAKSVTNGSTAAVAAEGSNPQSAIARALGRCGGAAAEALLVRWVRARGPWSESAAYGLGDMVARHGSIGDEAVSALLDVASSGPAGLTAPTGPTGPTTASGGPQPASFLYALGRMKRVPDAFAPRLVDAARGALANAVPERIFAVRALSRGGAPAAPELVKIVRDRSTFTVAERAEAARGLGQLEGPGRQAAGDALASLVPSADPIALMGLAGDEYGVLSTLLDAFHGDVPKTAEPALLTVARLNAPGAPDVLGRRLAQLRCSAASSLAKDAYDHELLMQCDAKGTASFERARLASLVRAPLSPGKRRDAWKAIARSTNLQVREAALEAIGTHPELGDAAHPLLVEALRSGKPGLVATAADVIHAHPENKKKPALRTALAEALTSPWSEDLLETKISLIDAAVSVDAFGARPAALGLCTHPNVTLRERATKALAKMAPDAASACVPGVPKLSPEASNPLSQPTKITLETDAGRLALVFDPSLAPITVSRLVGLAQSGFYKGMRVHRVVPGYVVQFGDPDGDGYGGSGRSLRCETSPVPFQPLTVGMALAGRDTGSSQIFVTLSRTPHLDGEYTRVGRAEGDWAAVAQGDVIHEVRVEP